MADKKIVIVSVVLFICPVGMPAQAAGWRPVLADIISLDFFNQKG
jgi:hypothetical protein